MTGYIWEFEDSSNKDAYAEYDQVGGGIIFYLHEIKKDIEGYFVFDNSGIYVELICGLLEHEHIHEAISDSVDTLPDQEHDIMTKIREYLSK